MNRLIIITICMLQVLSLRGQELTMYPGFFGNNYYQDHKQITRSDFEYLLHQIPESYKYWNRSKRQGILGSIVTVLGSALITNYLLKDSRDRSDLMIGGGSVLFIGGLIIQSSGHNSRRDALISYNFYVDKMTTSKDHLKIGVTENGLGLVASF